MSKYYNLDSIRTEINKDIAINRAYVDAWKKVSFPTKKDGKPFSVMSKNISGARYAVKPYMLSAGQYELTVTTNCEEAGYISDSINAYELVRYLKDERKLVKIQNYQPKERYLEQVYTFDLDDIKEAVRSRIEYLENYIDDLERQLSALDSIFNNFRNAYDNAIRQLEKETSEFSHKDVFYAVKDCVLSRYPYV